MSSLDMFPDAAIDYIINHPETTKPRPRPVNYVDGYLNGTGWSRRATLKERVLWRLHLLKVRDARGR